MIASPVHVVFGMHVHSHSVSTTRSQHSYSPLFFSHFNLYLRLPPSPSFFPYDWRGLRGRDSPLDFEDVGRMPVMAGIKTFTPCLSFLPSLPLSDIELSTSLNVPLPFPTPPHHSATRSRRRDSTQSPFTLATRESLK